MSNTTAMKTRIAGALASGALLAATTMLTSPAHAAAPDCPVFGSGACAAPAAVVQYRTTLLGFQQTRTRPWVANALTNKWVRGHWTPWRYVSALPPLLGG